MNGTIYQGVKNWPLYLIMNILKVECLKEEELTKIVKPLRKHLKTWDLKYNNMMTLR